MKFEETLRSNTISRSELFSGILAGERSRYYKALSASQDGENGYDLTYFAEYYMDMLARTVSESRAEHAAMEEYRKLEKKLDPEKNRRVLRGARWMTDDRIESITAEKWKNKFRVSFETARKDLMLLVGSGVLKKRMDGRKMYFDRNGSPAGFFG